MWPPIRTARSESPRERPPVVAGRVALALERHARRAGRRARRARCSTCPSTRPAGRRSSSPVSACSSRSCATTRPGSRAIGASLDDRPALRSPRGTARAPASAGDRRLWYGIRVAVSVLKRVGIGIAVLVGLCAFYVGYRQLYLSTGWTRPFAGRRVRDAARCRTSSAGSGSRRPPSSRSSSRSCSRRRSSRRGRLQRGS